MEDLLPKKGYVVAGKYQIEGTLGTGGMGAVFEVSHRITGKRFAVKWLLPNLTAESDAVMRFIREAQVAGRVDHPNVVEVYDVGQEGDSFYMVMELLQGEPLAEFMTREGKLTPAQACRIMVPVMSGLTAAHAAGVIHRDLKPDNIYLCHGHEGADAVPKVLDFGISKMSNLAGEVTSGITRAGMVMGTPHYMAPEQVRAKPVDVRTDVYALGVIMYEMLAGELPFPGDTYSDLVLKIMTEAPKPLGQAAPGTPPALVQVVERAMSRDPDARFADVAALSRALAPFAGGLSLKTPAAPSRPVHNTPPRIQTPLSTESERLRTDDFPAPRKPISLIVGVAAIAIAVIGLGFWLARISTTHAPPVAASRPLAPPVGSDTAPAEPAPTPTVAADAPLERPSGAPNAAGDLPTPHTVRIGPDPTEPARAWQPPPGSNEAPRPATDGQNAAPQPEPAAAAKPSALEDEEKSAHSSRSSSRSSRSGSTKPSRGDRPNPPSPAATQPAGNHRSLGLSMDDF